MAKREEFPPSVTRTVRELKAHFRGDITPEKAEFAAGSFVWFNSEDARRDYKNMKAFQRAVKRAVKQDMEG